MVDGNDRLRAIRRQHRLLQRRAGLPCGFSPKEVIEVRRALGRGDSPAQLAQAYGVTERQVRKKSITPLQGSILNVRADAVERRSIIRRPK